MKLRIDQLSIEVTRICNMACAHCMRGNAQNKDIDVSKLKHFLSQVESIGSIVFTGGEPTLNSGAIKQTLALCKEFDIFVNSFYIVTNGKEISSDFLSGLIDWYAYCDENGGDTDMCGVALSQDEFHEPIELENISKLKALSFFWPDDKKDIRLINLGRAKELHYNKREHSRYFPSVEYEDESICIREEPITLTVDGDIIYDCDYEYNEVEELKIANWENATDVFYKMATERNYICA